MMERSVWLVPGLRNGDVKTPLTKSFILENEVTKSKDKLDMKDKEKQKSKFSLNFDLKNSKSINNSKSIDGTCLYRHNQESSHKGEMQETKE